MTFDIKIANKGRTDLAKMFGKLGFKRGAEVGVGKGEYSKVLCTYIKDLEKLYLVDPWDVSYDDPFNKKWDTDRHETHYKIAKETLGEYSACKFIRQTSLEAVKDIDYCSLDFVYIDGSHTFDYAMTDIIEWGRRVKSGGIISGDDYKPSRHSGVIAAVNTYVQAHRIEVLNVMFKEDPAPRGIIPNWWFRKT